MSASHDYKFPMGKSRVNALLSKFARKKVLVFGDVGVDKYTIGKVSRISPEAPIPVVEVTSTLLKLGLASNVAENVRALGAQPLLVGAIGKDVSAHDFRALLKKTKVPDAYLVVDGGRKTTVKERVVAETQQVVRIDHETQKKVDGRVTGAVWENLEKALKISDCVVIEDYAKGLVDLSLCRRLIAAAEDRGLPVLVDPNKNSSPNLYLGCTVITPNTSEAEAISGVKIVDMPSLERAGARILDEVNAKVVIITRGRDGMAIFSRGEGKPHLIPTFAREVFDVSGAGDTVIATLALCLVSGANIEEAAVLANCAAGVEVGKRGTATVSVEELKGYIEFVRSRRGALKAGIDA